MTDMMHGKSGVAVNDTTERAQAAVRVFRGMQPTLSAFARVLTGNPKIRVEMTANDNGSTDGKRIWMRPPIELGDRRPHERSLCDKRDGNKQLLCAACLVREKVMATIYHEIAHNAFGTFTDIEESAKRHAIVQAVRETGGRRANAIADRIMRAPAEAMTSYMQLASYINEYLPTLVNSMEDARVDLQMFASRLGTRKMFDADAWRIFEHGVEQVNADGKTVVLKWSEYPLNSQVMVGVYVKALGYNYQNWFHEDVVTALNDEVLTKLLDDYGDVKDAQQVYYRSVAVMNRLRDLGFLGTPQDPDPEPEENEESDEDAESGDPGEPGETGEPGEEGGPSEEGASGGDPSVQAEQASGDGPSPETGDPEKEAGSDSGKENEVDDEASDTGASGNKDDAESSDDSDEQQADGSPEQGNSASQGDAKDGNESTGDSEQAEASSSPGDNSRSVPQSGNEADQKDVQEGSESGEESGEHDGSDEGVGSDAGQTPSAADDSKSDKSDPERSGDSPDEEWGDEELVDTGADDGYGGTELTGETETKPRPEMGTPDDAKAAVEALEVHGDKPKTMATAEEEAAISVAVIQGLYFTTPSSNIGGVREHTYANHVEVGGIDCAEGWTHNYWSQYGRQAYSNKPIETDENLLTQALIQMRVAFSDNKRSAHVRHRKYGKVDGKVLGRRAPLGDDRLFKKKIVPGKRDYFVVLGGDISGSTFGLNLHLIKKAIHAQATLLARLGVPFAVYMHSGDTSDPTEYWGGHSIDMDIYQIKGPNEPWSRDTEQALFEIGPHSVNLDGHSVEYYRKVLDKSTATDRIIMYYTDGEMPAENHDEELEILQREIKICKNKGYTLMGVGVRTDSPIRHGLDTVQVDGDADIIKVVKHLQKRLAE